MISIRKLSSSLRFQLAKASAHLLSRQPGAIVQQMIGLTDQLHIAVFDAVVDHFHVVAGAVRSNPITAGRSVDCAGRDRLKNLLDQRHACGLPPGMMEGAVTRAFLTA